MKQCNYEKPKLEIIFGWQQDVITTSTDVPATQGWQGNWDFDDNQWGGF